MSVVESLDEDMVSVTNHVGDISARYGHRGSWCRARHLNTPPRARHLKESKHSTKSAELLSSQGLGEDVYNLLLCADVDQVNVSSQNLLSNKMVMDLYVFGLRVEHWVPSQLDATKVVTIYDNSSVHMHPHIHK